MQDFKIIQRYLIVTILFSLILRAKTFTYKDAKNWGQQYPECNGKHQSPIFLNLTNEYRPPSIQGLLSFTDLDKEPTKITIRNTGHTVEMKAHWAGEPSRVTGGPLHGNYVFEKTTFHWAQKRWSEDVTHNRLAKAEALKDIDMHIFFYRKDLKSFEKAQSQKGGLAVMKAWLKSVSSDFDSIFDGLEKSLHKVQTINSTAMISPFSLFNFIDDELKLFLFYKGSLDYPPCSESVTWLIYDNDVPITKTLVNEFRKIKLAEGDVSNVRPVQPLNNRHLQSVSTDK